MSRSLNSSLFFYQGDKLVTVKQGDRHRAIFRSADVPLAEQQADEAPGTGLLATDDKGSVLQVSDDEDEDPHTYTAYGHDSIPYITGPLLGFNGELRGPVSGQYLLGNGYRSYSPVIMRFNCPDSLSPFQAGGVNCYAYCNGNPVNLVDPTGHIGSSKSPRVPSQSRRTPAPREPSPVTIQLKDLNRHTPVINKIIDQLSPYDLRALQQAEPKLQQVIAERSQQNASRLLGQQTLAPGSVPLPDGVLAEHARSYHVPLPDLSSTDSTPAHSRSPSPDPLAHAPQFVVDAIRVRRNGFNSERNQAWQE